MNYITVSEAAEKWGVSKSLVRRYLAQNRIPKAKCNDGIWSIPETAKKPPKLPNTPVETEELCTLDEFMNALQTKLATQQPNYPNNAESILEVLFDAYNESSGFDNAAIKSDFEELYRLMNGKPLKEIDEIIYAVCTLCRDHEKAGFIEGIKVGMSIVQEIACRQ